MFTGIIQAKGKVASIERNAFGARLVVDRMGWPHDPALGDSICVSGVCLTVAEALPTTLGFDVIVETLSKTTLGWLAVGQAVNLEPAVTPTQPMGGHFVQGHVDGVGTVADIGRDAEEYRLTIEPPPEAGREASQLMNAIVPKGSITVDGVSLTVAGVKDGAFEVALIPTTLELTTLGALEVGSRVNLETDILSKTIVHYLRRHTDPRTDSGTREGVTRELLQAAGFVDGA